MHCFSFYVFVLAVITVVFCAGVREFPFGLFNDTDIEENATALDLADMSALKLEDVSTEMSSMSTVVSEVVNHLIHLEEEINETMPENLTWTAEAGPILSALRNFWAQASVSLLEPIDHESTGMVFDPVDKNTKQVFRAIEHGLLEATTMLASKMEETTDSTLEHKESNNIESDQPEVVKRLGEISDEIVLEPKPEAEPKETDKPNIVMKTKRQNAFDLMANMSLSCSTCYEELNTCVQQCFVQHNCHDIQRGVRACPPVPSRLCNPFTQWNPIDECVSHSDCKSPLLCCSDGCVNKCLPGVWIS